MRISFLIPMLYFRVMLGDQDFDRRSSLIKS